MYVGALGVGEGVTVGCIYADTYLSGLQFVDMWQEHLRERRVHTCMMEVGPSIRVYEVVQEREGVYDYENGSQLLSHQAGAGGLP